MRYQLFACIYPTLKELYGNRVADHAANRSSVTPVTVHEASCLQDAVKAFDELVRLESYLINFPPVWYYFQVLPGSKIVPVSESPDMESANK